MKENSIRRAVREGRAALGTALKEFASRGVPWIIEEAGFDYCAIDHEHGAFDMETIANLASWFQATNVTAIVRIHKSFAHLIPGILDQGIMGIQVSEVETAQKARATPPPERPRSSSTISTSVQPSCRARSASAYCRRWLSLLWTS
jgi:2-keto-3-deoxy-L-rhamnonate aldolase RhmA